MTLQEIEDNMFKSFKGTFESALKNGYKMDKIYVIVDWMFYHNLLKKEQKTKKLLEEALKIKRKKQSKNNTK